MELKGLSLSAGLVEGGPPVRRLACKASSQGIALYRMFKLYYNI